MTDLNHLLTLAKEASEKFASLESKLLDSPSAAEIEKVRLDFLGRKGLVTDLMEQMRGLSKEDRPMAGKVVNEIRQQIDAKIALLKDASKKYEMDQILQEKPIDISLPVNSRQRTGSLHPVSLMKQVLMREFRRLGFTIVQGPEVDLDFYNFSALNFQDDHPARDMQDTFFVKNFPNTVLRTQTSNIQIHAMMGNKPPLRMVAMGRTFRCDSDITHTPMFHQIEGFIIDQNISLGDLKGVVDQFLKAVYGQDLETRLRPSYFPFVEPGGEVDLQCVACRGGGCKICKETGWLEIGGLGMIHPNVFEAVGYDSERFTGFAFGFGIDRMAMLKYGITDLRVMFDGDQKFQSQFPVHVT